MFILIFVTLDKLMLPIHMGLFKFWFLHLKY